MKTNFTRKAAWPGKFYPADKHALEESLDQYLGTVDRENPHVRAIIVPHAGYIYSGPIAGAAYAYMRNFRSRFERVIIIGPAHRVAVRGLALSGASSFETPLGLVRIDQELAQRAKALPFVKESDAAHELEHCIEVQLPFLQKTLGGFTFLPLLAGEVEPGQIALAIETLIGSADTLLVISSDLSHFYSYQEAKNLDQRTIDAVEALSPSVLSSDNACGYLALQGCMLFAAKQGWKISLLQAANSCDTAGGDPDRVVGYASFIATG